MVHFSFHRRALPQLMHCQVQPNAEQAPAAGGAAKVLHAWLLHLTASHSHSFIILTHAASLDLSDDDECDEAAELPNSENHHSDDELTAAAAAAAAAAADIPATALVAARVAVVEDLQLLLCSMLGAVDDQVLSSQAALAPRPTIRACARCPHFAHIFSLTRC